MDFLKSKSFCLHGAFSTTSANTSYFVGIKKLLLLSL
jgi:hypothetical protein